MYKLENKKKSAHILQKIKILNSNDFMRIIMRGRELPEHLLRQEYSFNNRGDKGSQVLK